ncbi:diadenylate cyclase [Desulfosarcina sp.]|uniref:diadenylate cyclase n=1 Tax=Desulfosarcina sp. TaxID=2027861 RepID=UPI00356ACE8D
MPTLSVFHHLLFKDFLDIIILTFFAYHLYVWLHQTKAFKALVGLLGLGIIYSVAQFWGLFLTTWVFQILWQVLIILIIILFQAEIRQVLEKVNPFYALGWYKTVGHVPWIDSFSKKIFELGAQRTGALIIFERKDRLREFVTGGIPFEADPTGEILVSIFQKHSPLHDGAMLIHNGKITMAAAFLPLTSQEGLSKALGTRHRSAIGITERCDAWALVVSEERGQVSLVRAGVIETLESPASLAEKLKELLTPDRPDTTGGFQKIKHLLSNRWRIKAATLMIVSVVWFSFAGQQDVEISLEIPLTIQNLPPQLEVDSAVQNLLVTARGQRKDIGMLSPKNIRTNIDLSRAGVGTNNYFLDRQQLLLPNDRVEIVRIEPNSLTLEVRAKPD